MESGLSFFQKLFSTDGFMPHGHCYMWEPFPFWLTVVSDSLIAASYFTIPFVLAYFVRKRSDLAYRNVFWLFVAFILFCGITHLLAVVGMWQPLYRLEGVMKLATGIVSASTAVVLAVLVPKALAIPTPEQYRQAQSEAEVATQERHEALIANRLKSEFLANMSHEIRTPMTGIIGGLELLDKQVEDPRQLKLLKIVRDSSERLTLIINDVLDLSRIEAGKLALSEESFSPAAVVGECLDVMTFRAEGKSLILNKRIAPDVPGVVRGDPGRLGQVLNNLISNAVKFTDHGSVEVHANVAARQDKEVMLEFAVKDTGIGIARDNLERIFEAFTQEDSRTYNSYGGTGLGLTIAQQLVQLMGGSLSVESEKGKGSCFTFTVRFTLADDAEIRRYDRAGKAEEDPFAPTGRPSRLLLVEDIEANQVITRQILEEKGHEVVVAGSEREAMERFRDDGVDLVLMDIRVGRDDGKQIARAMRKEETNTGRRVPIIGLSAQALPEEKEEAFLAGMDSYLTKPTSAARLIDTVESFLLRLDERTTSR